MRSACAEGVPDGIRDSMRRVLMSVLARTGAPPLELRRCLSRSLRRFINETLNPALRGRINFFRLSEAQGFSKRFLSGEYNKTRQ